MKCPICNRIIKTPKDYDKKGVIYKYKTCKCGFVYGYAVKL